MKNKDFFYEQYDKIDWKNQEKTRLNYSVNDFIISRIIGKNKNENLKVFDIGFGIGFFVNMLCSKLNGNKGFVIEGCEPSEKNYKYFVKNNNLLTEQIKSKFYNKTFLECKTKCKFDFITAIYVFPHFVFEDLEETARKIYSMLNKNGRFVLVVANEKYILEKLKSKKDLLIETNNIEFDGKHYKEVLHYSDIPEIGKVIDYNREEKFYVDLFRKNGFDLDLKKDLNDNGFVCSVFVFRKL